MKFKKLFYFFSVIIFSFIFTNYIYADNPTQECTTTYKWSSSDASKFSEDTTIAWPNIIRTKSQACNDKGDVTFSYYKPVETTLYDAKLTYRVFRYPATGIIDGKSYAIYVDNKASLAGDGTLIVLKYDDNGKNPQQDSRGVVVISGAPKQGGRDDPNDTSTTPSTGGNSDSSGTSSPSKKTPEPFPESKPWAIKTLFSTMFGGSCSTYECWIKKVWAWAMIVMVPLSVLVLSGAGVVWMTSEGNPDRISLAKKLITGVVSGIGLILVSYVLFKILGLDVWNVG